jgi:hypothetical protein
VFVRREEVSSLTVLSDSGRLTSSYSRAVETCVFKSGANIVFGMARPRIFLI